MRHLIRPSVRLSLLLFVLVSAQSPRPLSAQALRVETDVPRPEQLVRVRADSVRVEAPGEGTARLILTIAPGWHVNANPPALDYMIATEVSLEGAGGLRAGQARYPAPHKAKLSFEDSELLVYDGTAAVSVPIAASPGAAAGVSRLSGKIRFQACNDQVCLPPATVSFEVPVVVAARSQAAAPETVQLGTAVPPSPAPASSGRTESVPQPAQVRNPIEALLDRGPIIAFLSLFLLGLALNLTPCVYPMLGVTVSIFGARRAAPPGQVIAYAMLYVLGMAVMYSTLGVVAALSGGLFGGFLQSSPVLIGIGLLLVALSLSMFGLYELQPPAALLTRLGGANATSALGIFISGLVVGVFAAPCIGPPVVALLALVGAKGDPWFGFSTFFTLSLGLGAPYLVLGTFSNLLQKLPRSGEWMVWVKKLFGVILLGVGAFYLMLGIAPRAAGWVVPVTLLLGGLYLGFVERSGRTQGAFRWVRLGTGALALLAGIVLIATTPKQGIAFEPFDRERVLADLPRRSPAMVDFSAEWCVPCHELERFTFTDGRVKRAAKSFEAYKVDLTRFDAPESERWRRQYQITGVPTVVFLDRNGREIREARVEGFLPPSLFLERMRYVADRSGVAFNLP